MDDQNQNGAGQEPDSLEGQGTAPAITNVRSLVPEELDPSSLAGATNSSAPAVDGMTLGSSAADSSSPTPPVAAPEPPAQGVLPPENTTELLSIKQQALQSLAPLIDELEQTPEERFKTLMMMIQASDNPTFVDEAYEAATHIEDEKARAQALLDVVNEINYFTQPKEQ